MTDHVGCHACTELIEEDSASTSVSCCGGRWHTNCFLNAILPYGGYSVLTLVNCPGCQTVLWEFQYAGAGSVQSMTSGAEEVAAQMANPGFRADLKVVRSKIRTAQRAHAAVRRIYTERGRAFQIAIQAHVDAIKEAKREALAEINAAPEIRAHASAARTAEAAKTRFIKKFNLPYMSRWQLFGRFRRRSRWGRSRWLGMGRFRIYI